MTPSTARGRLHERLASFINWIRADPSRKGEIQRRAVQIRDAIYAAATEDGLVIPFAPPCGSFAAQTDLRRRLRGLSEVRGQEIDIAFVIAPKGKDEERLDTLLPRFERYSRTVCPDTRIERAKHSLHLMFKDEVSFHLRPFLLADDPTRQV